MLQDLVQKIKEINPKRVLIQLPEGLITKSQELEELLNKEGIESFVSLEPCYGACDLRDCEAERLGCDLLVHVGHSDFGVKPKVPVLYYEWRIKYDPVPVLEKNFEKLKNFKKIGLVSAVNFLDSLEKAKKFLDSSGKKCFIGGQILGCNVSNALKIEKKIDVFLYIGSGLFHPLGLALNTNKLVLSLNVEKQKIEAVDKETFEKQRYVAQEMVKDAYKFGILVSTKPGQIQIKRAIRIKNMLESKGKKAWIFTMDQITPEKLLGLDLDCYVSTACPRIAIENRTSFKKPILNPEELQSIIF